MVIPIKDFWYVLHLQGVRFSLSVSSGRVREIFRLSEGPEKFRLFLLPVLRKIISVVRSDPVSPRRPGDVQTFTVCDVGHHVMEIFLKFVCVFDASPL